MPHRGQKIVDPNDEPLIPEKMTTAGPQPWHPKCDALRAQGFSIREISRAIGITFSRIQKYLNPESKAKAKARMLERERERMASDPEYAERMTNYRRRYMQHRAPERWAKKDNDA
jgi:hypothetical protein